MDRHFTNPMIKFTVGGLHGTPLCSGLKVLTNAHFNNLGCGDGSKGSSMSSRSGKSLRCRGTWNHTEETGAKKKTNAAQNKVRLHVLFLMTIKKFIVVNEE
jgi:hypothetical protein